MSRAVVCIASSPAQADRILQDLMDARFSDDDVSVLFPDNASTRDIVHERSSKAPEGAAAGASTGGVLGGAVGLLAGIGAIVVPGLGPLLAAGPILAALSGAAVGAAVGGVAGTLVGLGIPEYEAKQYEGRVEKGSILISVHTEDRDEQHRVQRIFENAGAEQISSVTEARV